MSTELPSPEWLAQARAWLAEVGDHDNHDHPHPNDVARLLAALDAEKVRAQTAEDALAAELSARDLSGEVLQRCDAALNGPPETHWRSLHDVDVQVAALLARAQTAEDGLTRLRRIVELARVYRASVESEGTISDDLEDDARDALFDALDECPPRQSDADLAEASRREWKAQGMELAAEMLRAGGWEPGAVYARQLDARAADIKAGR